MTTNTCILKIKVSGHVNNKQVLLYLFSASSFITSQLGRAVLRQVQTTCAHTHKDEHMHDPDFFGVES